MKTFSVADNIIFALTLIISFIIGVYHAFKNRHHQSTKEVVLAGGNMGPVPVALSLVASFVSSVSMLGLPTEVYLFDTMTMWAVPSVPIATILVAGIYIPIYFNLKLTSIYEYLELRFSRSVRLLVTFCFCIYMIMYMSIVLYAPALAFNAVTGFSLWGAILSVGIVCTVYTAIGGMKAVLWTDCFQAFLMFLGVLTTLVWGSIKVGGMSEIWRIAQENGRIKLDETSWDPSIRYSVWNTLFGQAMMWTTLFGTNQAQVQRTLTCGSLKKAKIALWLSCPGMMLLILMGCLNGLVVFAYYHKCDPLSTGVVKAGDQLLPLFVMELMGTVPGLPGLFIAAVFSGSLSTVSSGLNSMAAVILQDFIRPFIAPGITDRCAAHVTKFLALGLGCVCLLFAYVASAFGGVVKAALSMFGILGSPVHGVIALGIIFPWANAKGAMTGLVSSMMFMLWIGIGSFIYKRFPLSPLSTEGCASLNITSNYTTEFNHYTSFNITSTSTPEIIKSEPDIFPLYDISFAWYMIIAPALTIVVGLTVSFVTGYTDPKKLDPRLVAPVFDILFPYLPESIRKPLRFGIEHKDKYKAQRKMSQLIKEKIDIEINPEAMSLEPEGEVLIDVKKRDFINGNTDSNPP